MGKYYCYRHVRNDTNVPFYIGIGTKSDKNFKTIESEYGRAHVRNVNLGSRSKWWGSTLNKCGGDISVDILYESDSYAEIKNKEIEFINLYGRKNLGNGTLVNLTNGGEGRNGVVVSDSTREKLRTASIGRKISESNLLALIKANTGRVKSKEEIEKSNKHKIGVPRSQETKEKLRISHTGKRRDPDLMKKISAKNTRKIILKYDLDGNFVGEFIGYKSAADSINGNKNSMSSIRHCTIGILKSYKGFVWKSPFKLKHTKNKNTIVNNKRIDKLDLSGNIIESFIGYGPAASSVGGSYQGIHNCIKYKRKTHRGFIWRESV